MGRRAIIRCGENSVTYRRPSDAYLDCGDGHTDAYQVFSLEDAPENQIAFLVDSGYSELNEKAIKMKWQKRNRLKTISPSCSATILAEISIGD